MNRALIAAAIFSLACAVPAPAVGQTAPPQKQQKSQGPDFSQRKAQILKMLDDRIAGMQRERKCVQAAKSADDIRACRGAASSRTRNRQGGTRARRGPADSLPPAQGK